MRILTFDIEDWFHMLDHSATRTEADWGHYEPRIAANVERILETLSRHEQRATFFCLGWVARRHPEVLQMISAQGHEIGSHSNSHQLVYEQTPRQFEADLRESVDALEQAAGQRVRAYRAPGFSIVSSCEWAFEKLAEAGIEIDCSVFPAPRAHGGLPGWSLKGPATLKTAAGSLKLFPMNVVRFFGRNLVFSGGGYFRLCPMRLLETLFARQDYIMTYFHPRDFDPDQPVLPGLSAARRFKSYVGLSSAMQKLERLLGQFSFEDLDSAERHIDWRAHPSFSLDQKTFAPVRTH
jgi:peptidoglycan-N-acetylglucosamine deacetylase